MIEDLVLRQIQDPLRLHRFLESAFGQILRIHREVAGVAVGDREKLHLMAELSVQRRCPAHVNLALIGMGEDDHYLQLARGRADMSDWSEEDQTNETRNHGGAPGLRKG